VLKGGNFWENFNFTFWEVGKPGRGGDARKWGGATKGGNKNRVALGMNPTVGGFRNKEWWNIRSSPLSSP